MQAIADYFRGGGGYLELSCKIWIHVRQLNLGLPFGEGVSKLEIPAVVARNFKLF